MKKLAVFMFSSFMLMSFAPLQDEEDETKVTIQLSLERVKDENLGGHLPKIPMRIPSVSCKNHTLYLHSAYDSMVYVKIWQTEDDGSDSEGYQSIFFPYSQTMALPSSLIGGYNIRVSIGNYSFIGFIDFE